MSRTGWFVTRVARFFEQEGYSKITGHVFARLLTATGPMALPELVSELGVSKASVSMATRRLERQGILERVRLKGDRKAYYRIAADLPSRIMALRIDRVNRFRTLLEEARPGLSSIDPEVRARLQELGRAYLHMLTAMTEMRRSWRVPNPTH